MFLFNYFITTTLTVLDIIHHPVFYLKHDVSETGSCLHLQVEPTQVRPVNRASLRMRQRQTPSVGPIWVDTTRRDRIQSPKHRVLNKRHVQNCGSYINIVTGRPNARVELFVICCVVK
jgi:hypothetical protein